MAGILREVSKLFSLRTVMKSNIISGGYGTLGGGSAATGSGLRNTQNSTFSSFTASRLLSIWLTKMVELRDYETTELSNTSVSVFHDYLYNKFNKTEDIVSFSDKIKDGVSRQRKINKIIKQLGLVTTTKDHLNEIVYYGSYCIKIDWDKRERVWKKYELFDPYSVITLIKNGVTKMHLVTTQKNKLAHVAPNAILRIGKNDFRTINDCLELKVPEVGIESQTEDSIVSQIEFTTGTPLFYNLIGKVKEYILKDQIVSLLSIKDLIQPLLLLIRVDKQTDPTEANRMALNTENLINKYSDLSAILGANFSIMDLMDSILNNIRVLPDYQSTIGDMNSVDLSKISQKISDIKSDQSNSKEEILASLGIPRALTAGDTNKWEAIKSSQRLNSKISGFMESLCDSYKSIVATLYFLMYGEEISQGDIEINLFLKTDIDYNESINTAEISNSLMEAVNRLLESVQRFLSENKLVDREAYIRYAKDKLIQIDPDLELLITDETVEKYLEELNAGSTDEGNEDNQW